MKKQLVLIIFVAVATLLRAQAPSTFSYQAVVRDAAGEVLPNQNTGIKISIISGTPSGIVVYSETHQALTNSFGLINIEVGGGTPVTGTFSGILWGLAPHYIKVEIDPAGGTSYVNTGTSQLLSVPYALYAEYAGSAAGGFWSANGNDIFNTNSGFVGVGTNTPPAKMVVQGDAAMPDTVPLFEVKDRNGATVFIVYPDSVRIYVGDDGAKTNKGTFAVSGRNTSKQFTHNYLLVRPDSSRIYTTDTVAGFGVENIETISSSSYMHLNPVNYFIGHNSGELVTTGLYNCTFGYKADSALTSGWSNIAVGYEAGKYNNTGSENVFMGTWSGYSNINGPSNIFIGSESGYNNIGGGNNVYIGYQSGYSSQNTYQNTYIGYRSGYLLTGASNTTVGSMAGENGGGGNNTFLGTSAGRRATGGNNTCLGNSAGYNMSWDLTGTRNTFVGQFAGSNTSSGNYNTTLGFDAGGAITTGSNNTYVGYEAGNSGPTTTGNICIGYQAGSTNASSNRLIIENSSDLTNPLIHGDFSNNRIAFHRTATTYPLQVGTTTSNGNAAYLTAGGTWTNGSSRSFKDRYTPINGNDVLSKIAAMELKGWYYKGTEEYHIGPFAEDFYQAFGCGDKNVKEDLGRYLASSDVAGVSMIAIQQLVKELEVQKKLNEELLKRIEALEKK